MYVKVNDTHRERLVFHSIQYWNVHTINQVLLIALSVQMFENVVCQIDSKNGLLLIIASSKEKFGLVFV